MDKKKKYGEVLTPISLVNEMLDVLPKEVWNNPNLKWLDPAAGRNMIFPIEVYKRLMGGLKEEIPNKSDRDAHIWDNMLYMVELQEDAVEEGKAAIKDIRDEYIHNKLSK